MARKFICKSCGQKSGVPIVYGMPNITLAEQAGRGEIVLGGCVVEENQPDRRCLACEAEWQIKRNPDTSDLLHNE